MKNDSQLQLDVIAELKWEPSIRHKEIGVAAKDGVVSLSGSVDSFAQRLAAERAAERVTGVRAVADDLQVKLVTSSKRTDTEIAHAAVQALDWDIEVPNTVKLKVANGWLTLEGTAEWQYQRAAAERAVRYLTGVMGVSNLINVKPTHVSPFEVSTKIKEALRRSADLDANRIEVEAADGKVVLRGSVRSRAERQDAERAAWGAPGVSIVDDRIAVVIS